MTNPRSALARAEDKLARMVALSSTFQGGRGYAEALRHVHRRDAAESIDRPLAVISPGDKHDFQLIAGGSQNHLRQSGSLFLYLARTTPPEFYDDRVLREDDAANWFFEIAEQVADLSGADDPEADESHLAITRISLLLFDECDPDYWAALGRFHFAAYTVEWGDA